MTGRFAGGPLRADASTRRYAYALEAVADDWKVIPDNFLLKIRGEDVYRQRFRDALAKLAEPEFWEDDRLWAEVAESLPGDLSRAGLEAYQFAFESPRIRMRQEFAGYALQSFTPGRPMGEALLDLTARIYADFHFDSGVTNVRTPPEEVFRKRRGVCQDFAHVQIACLRSINLAARYVSGYLRTYQAPGKERLIGADASDRKSVV